MDKMPSIDSLSTFIHHKKPHKFCFVGLKCQKCRDLHAFLGVKSVLLILVRAKNLTFSNSGKHMWCKWWWWMCGRHIQMLHNHDERASLRDASAIPISVNGGLQTFCKSTNLPVKRQLLSEC